MTGLAYLFESAPWAVGGGIVGYLMGRSARNLDVIAESVTTEDTMSQSTARRPWWKRITGTHLVLALLLVLALGSVVQGYVYNTVTQRIAECTRGYSNGFADAIEARSAATAAWQEALDQWMTTLNALMTQTPPAGDPAAARQRFTDATAQYLHRRAEAQAEQRAHPYPPPPRDVCK